MRRLFSALSFLTVLSVPKKMILPAESFSKSMAAFPVIGLLLGCLLASVHFLLSPHMNDRLLNILLLSILFLLTGGLHADGFMDTTDGIAGGSSAFEIMRIMKDSSTGAIGAAAFIFLTLLKWEALNSISVENRFFALLLFPAISRGSMVMLTYISNSAKKTGLGSTFLSSLSTFDFAISSLFSLSLSIFLFHVNGAVIFVVAGVSAVIVSKIFEKKMGGITGDVLGAHNEMIELFVLLLLAFLL